MNSKKVAHVSLFIQCLVDGLYPHVGISMARVLNKLGLSLSYPHKQTCCGQPAYNAGYRKEAQVAARHFIKVFEDSEVIVCPSGSCVYMIRHHYPLLFENDPETRDKARLIADRVFEFSEFLVDVLKIHEVGAIYEGHVTYHDSCHHHYGLGIGEQPRILINHVKGINFHEMRDSNRCCGFGGTFSIKYPTISNALVEEKVENIIDANVNAVVGCDMGCLMNIQGKLSRMKSPIKTMHLAQLLDNQRSLE